MEAFPEHNFTPEDFDLLVGNDGQLCDSKEELLIYNILLQYFKDANVIRERERFINNQYNESYVPDWIIQLKGKKIIMEYFGLYNSNRFPGYTEKANRKIAFYQNLRHYKFVQILPTDLKRVDLILNKISI